MCVGGVPDSAEAGAQLPTTQAAAGSPQLEGWVWTLKSRYTATPAPSPQHSWTLQTPTAFGLPVLLFYPVAGVKISVQNSKI